MHIIAAKAVAFGEALQPEFKDYAAQIVKNAKALSETLGAGGLDIVSGGTDNHLMLVDLRKKNATGKRRRARFGRAYITCNKNGIPFDPRRSLPRVFAWARRPARRVASRKPSSPASAN
jgi:glycine hydroxymethyltransferase